LEACTIGLSIVTLTSAKIWLMEPSKSSVAFDDGDLNIATYAIVVAPIDYGFDVHCGLQGCDLRAGYANFSRVEPISRFDRAPASAFVQFINYLKVTSIMNQPVNWRRSCFPLFGSEVIVYVSDGCRHKFYVSVGIDTTKISSKNCVVLTPSNLRDDVRLFSMYRAVMVDSVLCPMINYLIERTTPEECTTRAISSIKNSRVVLKEDRRASREVKGVSVKLNDLAVAIIADAISEFSTVNGDNNEIASDAANIISAMIGDDWLDEGGRCYHNNEI
jgi:hypothetical protein